MTLQAFEQQLASLLKKYPGNRPFVCQGNPLKCEAFIVGINAATKMDADFWDFWNSKTGFDKAKWFEVYKAERAAKSLQDGKKRRNAVSNTRQRIEWIVEGTRGTVSILETNLYNKATSKAIDLSAEDKIDEIFRFLLETIHPRFLFLHGAETRKGLEKITQNVVPNDKVVELYIYNNPVKVLAKKHLAYGWSREAAISVGKEMATYLYPNS